jgi:hypothetical protein
MPPITAARFARAAEIAAVIAGTTTTVMGSQWLFGSIIEPGIAPTATADGVQINAETTLAASNFPRRMPDMAATLAIGARSGPEK